MDLFGFFVLSIVCAIFGLFLGGLPANFPGAAVGLIFGAAMSIFILLKDVMQRLDSLEEKMKEKNK